MFNRRPISLLLASAVAMLTGAMARRGVPMLQDQVTTNGGNSRPSRRQRITPVRYKRGTHHRDEQRQASLRRRMGGNAQRIRMARLGKVFIGPSLNDINCWQESPRVLPEEVEARVKELRRSQLWGTLGCEMIMTEIRGMYVEIRYTDCGPVQFRQMEEAA